MNKLGDLLIKLRGEKTLREVAELTGISHGYIGMLERGYDNRTKKPINPSPEILRKLSLAYNFPYDILMFVAGYLEIGKESLIKLSQKYPIFREYADIYSIMSTIEMANTEAIKYIKDNPNDQRVLKKMELSKKELDQYAIKLKNIDSDILSLLIKDPDYGRIMEIDKRDLLSIISKLSSNDSKMISSIIEKNDSLENSFVLVPVLSSVQIGASSSFEDYYEDYESIPRNWLNGHINQHFILKVEDNSMIHAGIMPNDSVLCRRSDLAVSGQIVAETCADTEQKIDLKFFIQENGQAYLRSANPSYPDILMTDSHKLVGVMTGLIRHSSPTLADYEKLLQLKTDIDGKWTKLISKATVNGIEPSDIEAFIDTQIRMAKSLAQKQKGFS